MDNDLTLKYIRTFEKTFWEKYRDAKPPLTRILILQVETYPGPGPYTEEQAEKLYRQCLEDGKPWQDYPTIVHDVQKWYRSYMRAVRRGEVF